MTVPEPTVTFTSPPESVVAAQRPGMVVPALSTMAPFTSFVPTFDDRTVMDPMATLVLVPLAVLTAVLSPYPRPAWPLGPLKKNDRTAVPCSWSSGDDQDPASSVTRPGVLIPPIVKVSLLPALVELAERSPSPPDKTQLAAVHSTVPPELPLAGMVAPAHFLEGDGPTDGGTMTIADEAARSSGGGAVISGTGAGSDTGSISTRQPQGYKTWPV